MRQNEQVKTLNPTTSEVNFGGKSVLFCHHTAVAYTDEFGTNYVTNWDIGPKEKQTVTNWLGGKPYKLISQVEIEKLVNRLGRSLESLSKAGQFLAKIDESRRMVHGVATSEDPSRRKRIITDLGLPWGEEYGDKYLISEIRVLISENAPFITIFWDSFKRQHEDMAPKVGLSLETCGGGYIRIPCYYEKGMPEEEVLKDWFAAPWMVSASGTVTNGFTKEQKAWIEQIVNS